MPLSQQPGPIGVFDSGYGGLTILHSIRQQLPQYDYLYLGDNARAPYGTRSFDVVYQFTRQAVIKLFELGCQLIILGCNTASAKALRSIQQRDLPHLDANRRVLGVIRPTAEVIGTLTSNNHVGLLATEGTVKSNSYGEANSPGADYFVKKRMDELMARDPLIDTVILGCTHYPLLLPKIKKYASPNVRIVPQGEYVAHSLQDYLSRHPEMESRLTKEGTCHYLTTENPLKFQESAQIFLHEKVDVEHIAL